MPTLITRATSDSLEQESPCNFNDLTQNKFVEQKITSSDLQQRCARYADLLASLQPSQLGTMLQAANFTTDSVLQLIQQNPGSAFLRVYYGIDETGEHRLFMGPVSDSSSVTAMDEETLYVDDCCHCPPMGNCPNDELLGG